MVKKVQEFQSYTDEFKLKVVMKYNNGNKRYTVLAEELGIKNCTQLKYGLESGNLENRLIHDLVVKIIRYKVEHVKSLIR